jgi:hypothetical protein
MVAGAQIDPGQINQKIGSLVTELRDIFAKIEDTNAELGVITQQGLVAIGISSADAAVLISTMGNLAALSAIYHGGPPGAALNYRANSQSLWGVL